MHPAARKYDRQHKVEVRRLGLAEYVPQADRPCDVCGQSVGIVGRFVHPLCALVERSIMMIVAKGK